MENAFSSLRKPTSIPKSSPFTYPFPTCNTTPKRPSVGPTGKQIPSLSTTPNFKPAFNENKTIMYNHYPLFIEKPKYEPKFSNIRSSTDNLFQKRFEKTTLPTRETHQLFEPFMKSTEMRYPLGKTTVSRGTQTRRVKKTFHSIGSQTTIQTVNHDIQTEYVKIVDEEESIEQFLRSLKPKSERSVESLPVQNYSAKTFSPALQLESLDGPYSPPFTTNKKRVNEDHLMSPKSDSPNLSPIIGNQEEYPKQHTKQRSFEALMDLLKNNSPMEKNYEVKLESNQPVEYNPNLASETVSSLPKTQSEQQLQRVLSQSEMSETKSVDTVSQTVNGPKAKRKNKSIEELLDPNLIHAENSPVILLNNDLMAALKNNPQLSEYLSYEDTILGKLALGEKIYKNQRAKGIVHYRYFFTTENNLEYTPTIKDKKKNKSYKKIPFKDIKELIIYPLNLKQCNFGIQQDTAWGFIIRYANTQLELVFEQFEKAAEWCVGIVSLVQKLLQQKDA